LKLAQREEEAESLKSSLARRDTGLAMADEEDMLKAKLK
jgi:hypothetical protein